ncbi:hypothetical protein [Pleurocapsa sp. PCC 7319]|uniref:hypothetical protein n=1 Tax=Pleurocapsa sp. PCC 7319 TaxID=118161 RepID=UPI00034D8EDF|nr:hypothetical protein [Pleurocapsa sp. PCC 7319]
MDKIVSEYCYTTYIPFKRCREKSDLSFAIVLKVRAEKSDRFLLIVEFKNQQ